MSGDGPLSQDWRYYIAIMAVAIYGNDYFYKLLESKFLASGGEKDWVRTGITGTPKKMQNLAIFNQVIAYQPWTLYDKPIL